MANEKTKKPAFIRFLQWLFPWKGDSAGEAIRKLVFLIAVLVFFGAAGYLGNYFYQRYHSAQVAEQISNIYYNEQPSQERIPLPDGYNIKFDNLYQINQDIKGWINLPGTSIDFPVMQAEDNNYYLRRNIYKDYDNNGTPFLDYRDEILPDFQSSNLVIYGHNMKFEGVFGALVNYNDLDFYKEHPLITFDSVYQDMQWKVVSGFYVNTRPEDDNGNVFEYQNYIDLSNPSVFEEYVDQITKRSVIKTNIDVTYGDHLLTLSTCANEFKDGRFVVVARQVREGEDPNVDVSKATYNPNTVYPEIWYEKFPNTPRPQG